MNTKKLALLSLFTSLSLMIFTLESFLPPLVPIPGVKLGLANIITLIVLMVYEPKDAFLVLMLRIFLSSLFGGQVLSFLYSLCGGLSSYLVMILLRALFRKKYVVAISMAGGVSHNAGQIAAAFLLTRTSAVLVYLPFLVISGLITGFFTGCVAMFTIKRLWKQG